jgi:hypothetical protein
MVSCNFINDLHYLTDEVLQMLFLYFGKLEEMSIGEISNDTKGNSFIHEILLS